MIIICYEYIDQLWKAMPTETTLAGVTPVDALVGPLFDTCLHEFAHAMFDMLQVPVLGREEVAADQVSAYIMLHLGKAEARRLVGGVAYAYKTEMDTATAPLGITQFADVHGTSAQRYYDLLCIAYGADAQLFGDMVEEAHLPKERTENCKDEYRQVAHAYEKLIGPHIDPGLAKEVVRQELAARRGDTACRGGQAQRSRSEGLRIKVPQAARWRLIGGRRQIRFDKAEYARGTLAHRYARRNQITGLAGKASSVTLEKAPPETAFNDRRQAHQTCSEEPSISGRDCCHWHSPNRCSCSA